MRAQTEKLYQWALQKAESQRAPYWMALLFFLEILLIIPLDAVLIFFCLQNRKKVLSYVVIATIASTLSGIGGYMIGHFLWDLIGPYVVPHFISLSTFDRITYHLEAYESWAIFLGGLLPFPLKALSLASGVFHLGWSTFAFWFITARLLRFSLIGLAMTFWGEKVKRFLDRHFHRLMMLLGAKIAAAFLFFWAIAQ